MASNLHVKIDRHRGRGAEGSAFYGLHLQNAMACNGRGMDLLLSLSFEDIEALAEACRDIIVRSTDNAHVVASQPGTSDRFVEISEHAIGHPTPKKFLKKEDMV